MPTDWVGWHRRYDVEVPFRCRLALVRAHIETELRRVGDGARIVDMCAGDGRAPIGVLARGPKPDVAACLVERDPALVAAARRHVRTLGLTGIDVVEGDAGLASAYADVVPADLVIACGVFGHLTDAGVARMIGLLPSLCASDAAVVWTRHRREPDLVPSIRRWFADAGFVEIDCEPIADSYATVGLVRLVGEPRAFDPDERLFTFIDE